MKVGIPGGSGQIGHTLARWFHAKGNEVVVLTRNPSRANSSPANSSPAPWRVVHWDGQKPGAWISELEGSDVFINLAGRSVNCRHYQRNRREIYASRIDTTLLFESRHGISSPTSPRIDGEHGHYLSARSGLRYG